MHELQLKEGCICSLMRNMLFEKGLVKSAHLTVEQVHQIYIPCEPISTYSVLGGGIIDMMNQRLRERLTEAVRVINNRTV